MQQRTSTPSALRMWDQFEVPERQKPKRDRPIPKGTVVTVMGVIPGPVGIVRVFAFTPWGKVRTILLREEVALTLV